MNYKPTLRMSLLVAMLCQASLVSAQAIDDVTLGTLDREFAAIQPKMVEWRRDIHQNPELSGQEVRTAQLIADHLHALGLEVRTGVGGHGVVGLLKGARPGKVVALRADIDALPVAETTGLPFASKARQLNMGVESPVMHACGHDGHTAMLMGVAEVLAGMREQIPGTVKFIFQPAEEGTSAVPAPGTSWGAKAMVEDGALENPRPDAAFALHIIPNIPSGTIGYRSGPLFASSDTVRIKINGKQTHGAFPWNGVDPIVTAAQVITALQTVVSRQLNISKEPAVLSIGQINGGNRENIVPESVEMVGTLRAFDEAMRADAKARITRTAESIAAASGATAEVSFGPSAYPVTNNPEALTEMMVPVLQKVTGGQATQTPKFMASEDFSEFQKLVPGMYIVLGATPKGKTPATAAPNHNPAFDFDEGAMPVGAKTLAAMTLEYLARP
ncbi:MAG: amidohydrolase [Rhodocyclaceae bacterium]|nr:amidohydrolase [Rhodocyclaceae bacterium]